MCAHYSYNISYVQIDPLLVRNIYIFRESGDISTIFYYLNYYIHKLFLSRLGIQHMIYLCKRYLHTLFLVRNEFIWSVKNNNTRSGEDKLFLYTSYLINQFVNTK